MLDRTPRAQPERPRHGHLSVSASSAVRLSRTYPPSPRLRRGPPAFSLARHSARRTSPKPETC